ncbi:MAG TPA: ABC transporter permease [Candidatus Dormibacteraeota bacterium]
MATPVLVIEANPGQHLFRSLLDFWTHREMVLAFADRNIRVKYKQAVLGFAWAAIQPVAMVLVLAVTVGRLVGGHGYAAFALAMLVPWTFLQTAVTFAAQALITDAPLIRKVYFPREVSVAGAVLAAGLDLAIGLVLFAVAGPFLGAKVSPTWMLAPFLLLVMVLLATGVGCVFAALNVYYRDFRYALPFALQLWFFASPVAYPLSVVPQRWQLPYVLVNPAAGLFDSLRRVLTQGQMPDPLLVGISAAETALVVWAGYRVFKGLEPGFADVV